MNKLLIGLLVIAAGAGVYFLFIKKKEKPEVAAINKEWIIGKWKPGSHQPLTDSVRPVFQYEFQKDGVAYRSVSDTVKADTIAYMWQEKDKLLIKEKSTDTTGTVFIVSRLTQDSLHVLGNDSVTVLFTKHRQ